MSFGALGLGILLSVSDQASGPLKRITQHLGGLHNVGKKAAIAGTALTAAGLATRGVSQASRGLLGDLARVSSEFDQQLALIRSMPGVSRDAVSQFGKDARAWSKIHADTTGSYLESTYQALSAGLDKSAAKAATEIGLSVAKATRGDGAQATNMLASAYKNMGDRSKDARLEMQRMGDIITRTQQQFQLSNLNQLNESLKMGTPAAIAARVEFTQLNAVLGVLNNAGLKGSMGGTAFNASVRQMQKASKGIGFDIARNATGGMDFVKTLEIIQAELGDFSKLSDGAQAKLQKYFGDEGMRGIVLAGKALQELKQSEQALGSASGSTKKAQGIVEGSATEQWNTLMNNIRDLKLELGGPLLAAFREIKEPLFTLVKSISEFVKANPKVALITLGVVALGAALSPLLSITGGLLIVFSAFVKVASSATFLKFAGSALKFGKILSGVLLSGLKLAGAAVLWLGRALMLNPIGLIITGVALAALLIYKYWQPIKRFFGGLWKDFASYGAGMISGLISGIKSQYSALKKDVFDIGGKISGWFKSKMGIKSPSKVFQGFGVNIGQGMELGLLGSIGRVGKASKKLAAATAAAGVLASGPALAKTNTPSAASGGVVIHFSPQITVHGGGGQINAQVTDALRLSYAEFEKMMRRYQHDQRRRAF